MSHNDLLTAEVNNRLVLKLEGHEYLVEYPFSALIRAEEAIGKQLRSPGAWLNISWQELPKVLATGILTDLPDETRLALATRICEQLGPEGIAEVHEALCYLAFPKAMAQLSERYKKLKEKPSPNV